MRPENMAGFDKSEGGDRTTILLSTTLNAPEEWFIASKRAVKAVARADRDVHARAERAVSVS
jgi:hypothetical protein